MAVTGTQGALLGGRYRLLEPLGVGSMGSVWKAEHLLLDTQVAIKIIDPEVARLDFNFARFLCEAKTLAALRSPHIVQVLDFGTDADCPYLVMELLQGQTLGRRLSERGRLSLDETRRVVHDVCVAMSLVHEQGLVHRDLKPDNIFLCDTGGQRVTKVLDFGIAKSIRGDRSEGMNTRTGHLLGTPTYMSPEQCRGLKDIDHRADLWALGVIAYECLLGEAPFEAAALGDLLVRICMDPLPVPSQHAKHGLPIAFDAWFAQCVARDRSSRFQSASELATALAELSPPPPLAATPSDREIVGVVSSERPIEARVAKDSSLEFGRSADWRARLLAVAAVSIALHAMWTLGKWQDAGVPGNVEVQRSRPRFEVTPIGIRPRVPSGRRWQPSTSGFAGGKRRPDAPAVDRHLPGGDIRPAFAPVLAASKAPAPDALPLQPAAATGGARPAPALHPPLRTPGAQR